MGIFASLILPFFGQKDATLFLPEQASTTAESVDTAFQVYFWISLFFLVLITVLLVWFAIKFRKPKGGKSEPMANHNEKLLRRMLLNMAYKYRIGSKNMCLPPRQN